MFSVSFFRLLLWVRSVGSFAPVRLVLYGLVRSVGTFACSPKGLVSSVSSFGCSPVRLVLFGWFVRLFSGWVGTFG